MGLNKLLKETSLKRDSFKEVDDFEIINNDIESSYVKFLLKLNRLNIGILSFDNKHQKWFFEYSSEFKQKSEDYNLIIGFPDLNSRYESKVLWPFFNLRIPGLKQPRIKEILKKENIDPTNDVKLLQRFGEKTLTNPFKLEMV